MLFDIRLDSRCEAGRGQRGKRPREHQHHAARQPDRVDHEVGKIYELPLAGQRSRAVFAALILAAQAPLLRRDLAFAVWGEELPTTWASALRTAVSTVRRGLWACQPLAGSRLVTLPDAYQLLLPEQVDVDVIELLALVGSAQAALTADPTTALTLAAHCGRAATAVFLPGVTGAWVESWRNRLRGEIAAALRVEAEAALQTRRFLRARWAAERATTLEPFDESGQLLLLRSLVAARDAASALRAYHAYRRALVEDLGVEPGVDLQQAYLALLREARSDPPAAPGPIRISGPPGVHRPPSGLAKWAPDDAAALAEQAAARGDHIAAAQHFRVALDQLDSEDPATAEPRLGLADALNRTGSQRVAHRLCFEAAELARQLDRPGDLARAALTVGAGTPPWFDHDHLATLGLLREAIDAAAGPETGGGDAAVLAQLRSRLASWGTWTLPRDLRRQLSDDALDAAQQAGQPAALVAVLLDRGLTPPQRLDDVLVSEQAGAALLEQFGDHLDLGARFMAMCWLADGRLLRGDLTGTVLALGELAVLARGRDVVGFSWPVTAIRAMTAVISGDLVTGERLADQAREIGRDLPGTAIAVVHLHQLLVIRGLQGRAGVLVRGDDRADPGDRPTRRAGLAVRRERPGCRGAAPARRPRPGPVHLRPGRGPLGALGHQPVRLREGVRAGRPRGARGRRLPRLRRAGRVRDDGDQRRVLRGRRPRTGRPRRRGRVARSRRAAPAPGVGVLPADARPPVRRRARRGPVAPGGRLELRESCGPGVTIGLG